MFYIFYTIQRSVCFRSGALKAQNLAMKLVLDVRFHIDAIVVTCMICRFNKLNLRWLLVSMNMFQSTAKSHRCNQLYYVMICQCLRTCFFVDFAAKIPRGSSGFKVRVSDEMSCYISIYSSFFSHHFIKRTSPHRQQKECYLRRLSS